MHEPTIRLTGGLELLENWNRAVGELLVDARRHRVPFPLEIRPMTAADVDLFTEEHGYTPYDREELLRCLFRTNPPGSPATITMCVHLNASHQPIKALARWIGIQLLTVEKELREPPHT